MAQMIVEGERREAAGKNANRRLRRSGRIPAVMYGPRQASIPLSVDPKAVHDILYSESGHNTIFTLKVDGAEQANAMVKGYQLDPVSGHLIHTDFLEIALDRILQVTVNIEAVGLADGVKLSGGIMDIVTRAIDVECLPADIPDSIKVDVTRLQINDYIRVKDLPPDPKFRVMTDPEVVLITIVPPIKEEVPVEAPAEPAEPEVIKKGKVAEEGEEAPAAETKGKSAKPEPKEKDKEKEK
ncbi:MAG: 50S ribosomal protein L25 [Acidobacteria bacterium]|nr:MAG: 50S ribosomal protein L25 [Acidobacteriota bacterium]